MRTAFLRISGLLALAATYISLCGWFFIIPIPKSDVQKAGEMARAQDWHGVINFTTEGLKRNPEHPQFLNLRCLAHIRIGQLDDAERDCQAALKVSPSPVHESAFPGGPQSDAGTIYKEIPSNNLGAIRQLRRQHAEAIPFFEMAVEMKPEFGLGWSNLVVSYEALGNREKAWDAYQQLAKVDESRAKVAKAKFNISDSRPSNSAPVAQSPVTKAEPVTQQLLEQLSQPQAPTMQSETKAEKAVQSPSATAANVNDVQAAQRVVSAEPTNPSAWRTLAGQYASAGEFEKAIRAYQEALRLEPNNADTLETLGVLYAKSGQKDKVREVWENLAKIDKARSDKFFSTYILP